MNPVSLILPPPRHKLENNQEVLFILVFNIGAMHWELFTYKIYGCIRPYGRNKYFD